MKIECKKVYSDVWYKGILLNPDYKIPFAQGNKFILQFSPSAWIKNT